MSIPELPTRYSFLEPLGEGGMGRVLRVRDSLRGVEVALKLAPSDLTQWLRREFETLRQIHHENLVRVFDWGITKNGDVFYTMELVVGSDWGSLMGRPQSATEVARLISCVLRGLAHLHSHREIHGDLKPSNVLLGSDGSVKVSDVGMARGNDEDLLSTTPGYAAPELWDRARCDVRADLYSVGVMAYEALTGRHPFAGKTIREVVSGQLEGWVASPAAHGIRLHAGLEREIMRALERDPALRPSTADEFMEGIGELDRTTGILGGRFVARTPELERLDAFLTSDLPDSPTLIWVDGEEGIGKSALVDELSNRAIDRAWRSARVASLMEIGAFKAPLAPAFAESEAIWEETRARRTLFVLDSPDIAPNMIEAVRTLARHLHSIAVERGERCWMAIVFEAHQHTVSSGAFQETYSLSAFTEDEVGAFLTGYLGAATIQPEVVRWLTLQAGGVPGRLASIVDELIDRGFLRRHQGRWLFTETQDFPSIERGLHRGRWSKSLSRLNKMEQSLLAILSLLPQGLTSEILARIVGEQAVLDSLVARGWLRTSSGRCLPASGEVRRAVLESTSRDLTEELEHELLRRHAELLTREERAWLLLRRVPTRETLGEGLWASREARDRGDLRLAVERARSCITLAEGLHDKESAQEARLIAARGAYLLGDHDGAAVLIKEGAVGVPAAEQLLGLIQRSKGCLEDARDHLAKSIALAEISGDGTVFAQSSAELAEVEWRHGDQKARDVALARLKDALSREAGRAVATDDRAALIYQLGAALVTTGKRDEGKAILMRGVALSPSDYWKMRIANALAAAEYYLGNFDRALEWIDNAWQMADRGGFDSFKARIFSSRAGINYGLGKFREAVEFHRLASIWATRSGEPFEFMAACSGEAASRMLLAEYEQALKCAREAYRVACEIDNEYEALKNLEMEGACLTLVGDYPQAKVVSRKVLEASREFGDSAVAPRALMLASALARIDGMWREAASMLEEAERVLVESRDWEDLPFVQIELEGIRSRENASASVSKVASIVEDVTRAGALTVQLRGCVVLGEIFLANGLDHREHRELLVSGLGKAGEAGASEEEWRLHHILAELSVRDGDRKAAAIRLAQAVRVFRLVADRLSPEHRACYLRTEHAKRLLERAS